LILLSQQNSQNNGNKPGERKVIDDDGEDDSGFESPEETKVNKKPRVRKRDKAKAVIKKANPFRKGKKATKT